MHADIHMHACTCALNSSCFWHVHLYVTWVHACMRACVTTNMCLPRQNLSWQKLYLIEMSCTLTIRLQASWTASWLDDSRGGGEAEEADAQSTSSGQEKALHACQYAEGCHARALRQRPGGRGLQVLSCVSLTGQHLWESSVVIGIFILSC